MKTNNPTSRTPVFVELPTGVSLFIGRHPDTTKAEKDDDRVPTEDGIKKTQSVGNILASYGFIPDVVIVSPAVRAHMGAEILFGNNIQTLIYSDLYNFEQFSHASNLYKNNIEDPKEYLKADWKIVKSFQERFMTFLKENDVWKQNVKIAVISHAIIANFLAMIFTKNVMVYKRNLPGSTGFLISPKSTKLIFG